MLQEIHIRDLYLRLHIFFLRFSDDRKESPKCPFIIPYEYPKESVHKSKKHLDLFSKSCITIYRITKIK